MAWHTYSVPYTTLSTFGEKTQQVAAPQDLLHKISGTCRNLWLMLIFFLFTRISMSSSYFPLTSTVNSVLAERVQVRLYLVRLFLVKSSPGFNALKWHNVLVRERLKVVERNERKMKRREEMRGDRGRAMGLRSFCEVFLFSWFMAPFLDCTIPLRPPPIPQGNYKHFVPIVV